MGFPLLYSRFRWFFRRYLSGIIPLLYGGVVAWMFVGEDFLLALRIILCGTALPILLLLWAWWDSRTEEREKRGEAPEP